MKWLNGIAVYFESGLMNVCIVRIESGLIDICIVCIVKYFNRHLIDIYFLID